jgi:serine/threonine protein kinase
VNAGLHTSQHGLPVAPELPVLGADRFEILERIGAGGMGTVYKALQKSVGRPVAVKVLSSEYASTPGGVARFVREATVVSRLVHPNIVSMIEFGRDPDGNLLLVMELLEGESLRQLLRREKRLPPWRAVQIAMQVLAALRVAHGAGVIHRDLKPENIFITHVDGADHAKVLDFGVAKMLSHEVGQDTTAGSLVGTLKYMAPEQIAGDPPDQRVDLYALGVLLYEMLAGAVPYEHRERVALVRAILNEPPIPIDSRLTGLPAALADLVMRAIDKLSAERFQTADELRAALAPFAMVGIGARAPLFQITREIRLPVSGATPSELDPQQPSDTDRSGPPGGELSGAKALRGPPTDPSLISGTTKTRRVSAPASAGISAGISAGDEPGAPGAGALSAADHNPTTGAGLTSRTPPVVPSGARRTRIAALVGGAALAAAAALVGARLAAGRATDAGREVERPIRYTQAVEPGSASAGLNATTVLVRTSPAGAALRDGTTDELLCEHTPCMVPVAAGRQRRVRISLGAAVMEAVLDAAIPQLLVPLDGEEPALARDAATMGTEPDAAASALESGSDAGQTGARGHGSRRPNGGGRTNHGHREDPNGDIPIFGVAPGS